MNGEDRRRLVSSCRRLRAVKALNLADDFGVLRAQKRRERSVKRIRLDDVIRVRYAFGQRFAVSGSQKDLFDGESHKSRPPTNLTFRALQVPCEATPKFPQGLRKILLKRRGCMA